MNAIDRSVLEAIAKAGEKGARPPHTAKIIADAVARLKNWGFIRAMKGDHKRSSRLMRRVIITNAGLHALGLAPNPALAGLAKRPVLKNDKYPIKIMRGTLAWALRERLQAKWNDEYLPLKDPRWS